MSYTGINTLETIEKRHVQYYTSIPHLNFFFLLNNKTGQSTGSLINMQELHVITHSVKKFHNFGEIKPPQHFGNLERRKDNICELTLFGAPFRTTIVFLKHI